MLERRQLLVITVIFLHLAWLPNISMGSQTSALETKSNAVQEIKPDLSWKNKVIEVWGLALISMNGRELIRRAKIVVGV